jgi:hypothetical protein
MTILTFLMLFLPHLQGPRRSSTRSLGCCVRRGGVHAARRRRNRRQAGKQVVALVAAGARASSSVLVTRRIIGLRREFAFLLKSDSPLRLVTPADTPFGGKSTAPSLPGRGDRLAEFLDGQLPTLVRPARQPGRPPRPVVKVRLRERALTARGQCLPT